MIEKIDTNKIRGKHMLSDGDGGIYAGGDDTVESIKMVAKKLNEIIEYLNDNEEAIAAVKNFLK